jgi:antitoxin YefM
MPKYLTVNEAQQQLPQLAEELGGEPTIITKDGKPVMVALDFSEFESLLETLEILSDREFMDQLRAGIQQAERGETKTLEAFKAASGLSS